MVDTLAHDQRQDVVVLARARPFRLGAVEVRPATREIVGPSGREVAEPRVMQVLVALARAQGEVVTRDDLIASCWDGRIVGEDAITRVISRLRRHSEGVGREGWTLETVTKVGYRLIPHGHDTGRASPATAAAPEPRPGRRGLLVGGAIAAAAAAAVGGGLAWRFRPRPPPPEARALYEKGREALRLGLPDSTAQAIGFLRSAVAEAPDYADAWGGLSRAYQASLAFTDPARQPGVVGQARAAAKRALELDARQADAAATLALLMPVYRNWAAAERLYQRALSLHPGEPDLELGYGKLLFGLGRIREALEATQAAVEGDPYTPYGRGALGVILWSAGRTEEAELALQKGLALWPRHRGIWFPYFNLLAHTGRAADALAFAADLERRPVEVPAADFVQSLTSARALQTRAPADIEIAATTNITMARRGAGFAEIALHWLASLGRVDDAFAVARGLYLNEGFQIGPQRYSADQGRFAPPETRNTQFLFMAPTAPMRTDVRFGPLMRDVGIAAHWKSSGKGPDDPALAKI